MVFNIILRGFCYHMVAYSDVNKCYRRSQSWLTGGVVLDEFVAFATGFGSSTHHTQSPKTRPKPRLNTTPNLHHPTSTNHNPTLSNPHFIHHYPNLNPHTILFTSSPKHSIYSSIHPSFHTHPSIHRRLHAYTFNCKQIINFIYYY